MKHFLRIVSVAFVVATISNIKNANANCVWPTPNMKTFDIPLDAGSGKDSLSFVSNTGPSWYDKTDLMMEYQTFKADIARTGAKLNFSFQALTRNVSAVKLKNGATAVTAPPNYPFAVSLLNKQGAPIFGATFPTIAVVFMKCTDPNKIFIWEKKVSVTNGVDLDTVGAMRITFPNASKMCLC